jgi:membrane protein DedA with SNARE-associated domain
VTGAVTRWIAELGVYAVFLLMAVDALLPLGGELTMLFAGAIVGGAIAGAHASLFGLQVPNGVEGFVVLSLAGVAGSLAGALVAWWVGARGGRALVDRHGRRLRLGPEAMDRAERWFDRYGDAAVFIGRLTPVVRSFIPLAAGVLGSRLGRFMAFNLLAAVIWCFGFTAAGWAMGSAWTRVDHAFGYVDALAALAVVALLAVALPRRLRRVRS